MISNITVNALLELRINVIFLVIRLDWPCSHVELTSIDDARELEEDGKPSFDPDTIFLGYID